MNDQSQDDDLVADYRRDAAIIGPLYLNVWNKILSTFLGWSPDRIDAWAAKWADGLSGMDLDPPNRWGWFYHETAISYVTRLLIPDELWGRLSTKEKNQLQSDIERAITFGETNIKQRQDYDWGAAKLRVEAVLGRYGSLLPDSEGGPKGRGSEGDILSR